MLKVRWGKVVLKVYDKSGRVLRVEVKVHNTEELRCGKGLDKLRLELEWMQGMLVSFLNRVQVAHVAFWTKGSLSAGRNRASAGTDDWRAWI